MDTVVRAHDRAQRRFRRMVEDATYSDPTHRATRLYVEAERLIDRLRGEEPAFTLRPDLVERRMDALHDATHAELWELAEAEGLPDVPLALRPDDRHPALATYQDELR